MDDKERETRMKKFSDFLVMKFRVWVTSKDAPPPIKGSVASQAAFAQWLRIDPTNLSYFINQNRFCSEASAEKIAARLGSKVYDILGYARKMPEDPVIRKINDEIEEMDEEGRREILEIIASRKGGKGTVTAS